METDLADYNFGLFTQTLFSAAGLGGLIFFVFLVIANSTWPFMRWVSLTCLLYVVTLGLHIHPWFRTELFPPLEILRVNGRSVSILFLVSLILPAALAEKGWRSRLATGGAVAFFAFEIIYSSRLMAGQQITRGGIGIIIFCGTFFVFIFGVSRWLQTMEDAINLIRCFAWTGVLFIVGTLFCLAYKPNAIVWQNRLISSAITATFAAEIIAISLPPMCYLLIRAGGRSWARLFWGAAAGIGVIFLLWTGTRTGLLMTIIGLGMLFRFRIGKAIGAGIVLTVFGILVLNIYDIQVSASTDRMMSTLDTRSAVWKYAITQFVEHPVAGVVLTGAAEIQETTYLTVLARTGLLGAVPFGLFMTATFLALVRINRLRRQFGADALLCDLVTAGLVSIAGGAVFEGFLLATLNLPVFAVYGYLCLLTLLQDAAVNSRVAEEPATADGNEFAHHLEPIHSA